MVRCERCQEGELVRVGTYTSQRDVQWATFKCDNCGAQQSTCLGNATNNSGPAAPPQELPEYVPTWRVRVTRYRDTTRWKVRRPRQRGAVRLPRYGDK